MATTTLKKLTARLKLEDGIDAQGNMRYVNQALGDLNEAYYSSNTAAAIDKLYAIRTAIAPTLSKTIGTMETVATSEISSGS